MLNKIRAFATLLLVVYAGGADSEVRVIRYSVSTSWAMPYGGFDGEKLNQGIMYDLSQAIKNTTGYSIVFVPYPRQRTDFAVAAGEIDLRCYVSPAWMASPGSYTWSEKLLDVPSVIFGTSGEPQVTSLNRMLTGAAVSTVLGYKYPTLAPYFSESLMMRDDALDQDKVFLKVRAKFARFGVSDLLSLDWYKKSSASHGLSAWTLEINRDAFHCGIPKNSAVDADYVLKGINELKRTGQIERILRKYR